MSLASVSLPPFFYPWLAKLAVVFLRPMPFVRNRDPATSFGLTDI